MKRQKVDVLMAVDSSDSGQDSGHLVNPFLRVTKYMTRHLATIRESQLPQSFYLRSCIFHHIDIQSTKQKSQCQHLLRMNSGTASSVPVLS